MKQLTPLEELINWINSDCTPMDCVLKAKELLEKEKQVIVDAFIQGNRRVFYDGTEEVLANDYYNNKYTK